MNTKDSQIVIFFVNSQFSFLSYNETYHKKIKVYFLKIRKDEILALQGAEKNVFLNFEHYDLAIHAVMLQSMP